MSKIIIMFNSQIFYFYFLLLPLAPPFTYGSHPVRADPTDPRYLKHLPHPPLPHYPPDMHWRTNYKSHFVEPSLFKYERGAWKSPEAELVSEC
jgi:hypothetical protein